MRIFATHQAWSRASVKRHNIDSSDVSMQAHHTYGYEHLQRKYTTPVTADWAYHTMNQLHRAPRAPSYMNNAVAYNVTVAPRQLESTICHGEHYMRSLHNVHSLAVQQQTQTFYFRRLCSGYAPACFQRSRHSQIHKTGHWAGLMQHQCRARHNAHSVHRALKPIHQWLTVLINVIERTIVD